MVVVVVYIPGARIPTEHFMSKCLQWWPLQVVCCLLSRTCSDARCSESSEYFARGVPENTPELFSPSRNNSAFGAPENTSELRSPCQTNSLRRGPGAAQAGPWAGEGPRTPKLFLVPENNSGAALARSWAGEGPRAPELFLGLLGARGHP